jgi:beta-galactosidase
VTTNFMVTAHIRELDYWTWAPEVDVVANDHYLDHRLDDPAAELAFAADLTRGLAAGAPWMLMEHSTGSVNWQPHNLAKAPGQMIRDSLQHVARGADSVCFFQWRASLQGSEKFHSALIPHAGTDSALWREARELGALLDRMGEVAGTRVVADVALLFSWEAWWAGDAENRPSEAVAYLDQVWALHRALRESGATVDVVRPGADVSGYRLVVIPGLHLVRERDAKTLDAAVAAGAHALVTFYSGIVDENDRVRPGGHPAVWRDLLGIRVEEFAPVLPGETVLLESGIEASLWTERLVAHDADVLDRFVGGPAGGLPALTRRRGAGGAGDAWYLATLPDRVGLARIIDHALTAAGAGRAAGARPDVDVVRRVGPDRSYRFIINHGDQDVLLNARGQDLVTGDTASGTIRVPAGAVRVIREDADS